MEQEKEETYPCEEMAEEKEHSTLAWEKEHIQEKPPDRGVDGQAGNCGKRQYRSRGCRRQRLGQKEGEVEG